MKDALEYYAVLEVNHLASLDEIKLKYRDLAKHWHPDSNHASDAMEHFQKLSVAYDVLKNDDTRLMYDLLSEIYDKSSFPDMKNLSILKDKNGYENPFVRVIRLRKIRGKIISFLDEEEKLVLSYEQAKTEVLTASLGNWLLGWWHILAFLKNLQAIIANVRNIGKNQSDNLLLLVHNGIAYHQENKDNQALSSLRQALQYADEYQTGLINRFIKELHPSASVRIPVWHSGVLKIRQLIVPFLLAMIICYPLARGMGLRQYMKKENAITYFQKVKFNNGEEMLDDVVVSKIFSIPVNIADPDKLYHLTEDRNIMYGPGEKFDVIAKGKQNQSVRITGFTPDKSWYRVMIDTGEMGFVPLKSLQKGLGKPVPYGSKITISAE